MSRAIDLPSLRNTPRLHDDVIFVIIDHLYYDTKLLPDWNNFPQYALVARLWRIPVQKLLFHEVKITSTDANYEALRKAVNPSTEHGRLLRNCVRILNYTLSPGSPTIPAYKATSWEKRLPVALKLFPYLYELRLNIDGMADLSAGVLRALDDGTPPIRALQIGMRFRPTSMPRDSNIPLQLLHIPSWPLEAIVFRGEQWGLQNFSDFPPIKHQFYEVRWLCPEPTYDSLEPFLEYLTANSLKSLRIIHVAHFGHILPEWAPSLRSVLLTRADISGLQQLPHLPFLRELVICGPNSSRDVHGQLSTLATSTPKIEHVGFTIELDKITVSRLKKAILSLPQTIRFVSLYTPIVPLVSRAGARGAVESVESQENVSIHLYEGPISSRVGQVSAPAPLDRLKQELMMLAVGFDQSQLFPSRSLDRQYAVHVQHCGRTRG